ncbi:hypothetical protein N7510_001545 [Penicillium lagena]|uniref:uncharacterized protein n=1 Tax=Penicillium lagena TaxID=94218 RepID=UPI0025400E05|nr:uncharacterized protein N7510_001545 [Penicillium lagena]KAJ5625236.1 hypothetical protein N7510_001545 [Penicillium lagena]
MDRPELLESPRKRQKTDDVPVDAALSIDGTADKLPESVGPSEDVQALKEIEVGITEYVSVDNEGFSGILKKRYTDFLVNEILPSGEVLHLRTTKDPNAKKNTEKASNPAPETEAKAPQEPAEAAEPKEIKAEEFKVSEEDNALLVEYCGAENAAKIVALHKRAMTNPKAKPAELGKVMAAVSDRDLRTKIHQAIRRIFNSQLESSTDAEGVLTITAAPSRNKRNAQGGGGRGGRPRDSRPNWDELGGQYLHFTIYKENRDTMEVISALARMLKMRPKGFEFAGTKDRRGVTAQRACVRHVHAHRIAGLNSSLRNVVVGDFEHQKHGLDLGDLKGNEFVITLRECEIPGVDFSNPQAAIAKASELVGSSLKNLHQRGYLNYYGLQRFGTFSARTDTIGVKMLQGDFKAACETILEYSPHVLEAAKEGEASKALISTDDKSRAEAIHLFETGGNTHEALEKLPRKFSAESMLIRHLARSKNDYKGALQAIPRNLRLMYVHAYQSLVWNFAAGERWRLYGDRVVEGDLVIVHEHRDKEANTEDETANVDADGEVVVVPEGENSAFAAEDMFTRARALTADEAASGEYSIFDVVLPLPGFDIIYPPNQLTDFYRRFMGSEQGGHLDPLDMRRSWRDISLSGSYRKVLSRMGADFSFDIKLYSNDNEQFVQTDLEKLKHGEKDASVSSESAGDKVAVVLKFQLASSQYATMALRELTKGKVKAYKPDLGGGR